LSAGSQTQCRCRAECPINRWTPV